MKFVIGLVVGIFLANGLPKFIRSIRLDEPATPADWKPKFRRWDHGVEVDWNEERT